MPIRIVVGGKSGTSKSLLEDFAKRCEIKYFSAGNFFRELAKLRGVSVGQLGEMSKTDSTVDDIVDQRSKDLNYLQESFVLESRLGFLFIKEPTLKILLTCSDPVRFQRILGRENKKRLEEKKPLLTLEQITQETLLRENNDNERYFQLYGIRNCVDPSHYDISIDTTSLSKTDVVGRISDEVKKISASFKTIANVVGEVAGLKIQ